MIEKDIAIAKFRSLKNEYEIQLIQNNSLMEKIQKSIIKYEVDKYLKDNFIEYTLNERDEYHLSGNLIKQIDIDNYGFRVWSNTKDGIDPYIQYFHILMKDYYIFNDYIEVEKRNFKTLNEINNIIYLYDLETLNNIVVSLDSHVEKIKINYDYISSHNNPCNYSYEYGEHLGAVYPSNIIDSFNNTIEFIHNQIKKRFHI